MKTKAIRTLTALTALVGLSMPGTTGEIQEITNPIMHRDIIPVRLVNPVIGETRKESKACLTQDKVSSSPASTPFLDNILTIEELMKRDYPALYDINPTAERLNQAKRRLAIDFFTDFDEFQKCFKDVQYDEDDEIYTFNITINNILYEIELSSGPNETTYSQIVTINQHMDNGTVTYELSAIASGIDLSRIIEKDYKSVIFKIIRQDGRLFLTSLDSDNLKYFQEDQNILKQFSKLLYMLFRDCSKDR